MLAITHLRHTYPNGYEALKDVSLTVEDGEVCAIIGRSGAGKSTLLRCVNGLERTSGSKQSGSLKVDGQEVLKMNGGELRQLQTRVGFIWQEYNLIERLSVMQNVLSGRLGHRPGWLPYLYTWRREERELAVRNLERVNMLHRATHRADRLSGGEKQRVSIARALTQEPRVILADEPVASLDPELSEMVIADIVRIARDDNMPTLLNLHDVELATQFCDTVCAIAEGTVVYHGPASGLNDEILNKTYRFDRAWKSYSRGMVDMREPDPTADDGDDEPPASEVAQRAIEELRKPVGSSV